MRGTNMLTWQPILEYNHKGFHHVPPPDAHQSFSDRFWYLLMDAIIAINAFTASLTLCCWAASKTRHGRRLSTMSFKTAHSDGVYPNPPKPKLQRFRRYSSKVETFKTPPSFVTTKRLNSIGKKGGGLESKLSFRSAVSSLPHGTKKKPQALLTSPAGEKHNQEEYGAHVTVEDYDPLKDYAEESNHDWIPATDAAGLVDIPSNNREHNDNYNPFYADATKTPLPLRDLHDNRFMRSRELGAGIDSNPFLDANEDLVGSNPFLADLHVDNDIIGAQNKCVSQTTVKATTKPLHVRPKEGKHVKNVDKSDRLSTPKQAAITSNPFLDQDDFLSAVEVTSNPFLDD